MEGQSPCLRYRWVESSRDIVPGSYRKRPKTVRVNLTIACRVVGDLLYGESGWCHAPIRQVRCYNASGFSNLVSVSNSSNSSTSAPRHVSKWFSSRLRMAPHFEQVFFWRLPSS